MLDNNKNCYYNIDYRSIKWTDGLTKEKNMKKIIGGVLASMMAFTALAITGCGSSGPAHEHAYTEETVAATCKQEGYNRFVCECGDTYKGETVLPKTAHTGMVNCAACGVSYFDEVKQLVIENGKLSSSMYFYEGKTTTGDGVVQKTLVIYDLGDNDITLWTNYTLTTLNAEFDWLLTIPHPSEGTAMSEGKYVWQYEMGDASALGVLNGATFSEYTSGLSLTVQTGISTSSLANVKSLSASFAKSAIKDAFIPLLKLGKNGVTPANFGFVNFNL